VNLQIAILSYRVTDLVIDCLHSVAKEIGSVPETRVTVCENGTGPAAAERIQRAIEANGWGSWCSLIALPVNLGFTGGNNTIIRTALQSPAPPRYVLLLNDDTIVRPGAFRALVDFMDAHPKVGIAGSRLEDPDGTPQRSAFRFQTPISEFEGNLRLRLVSRLLSRWVVAPPVVDRECQTDWVPGASMIIRREVLETIGLLDEGLFTYFDDIDFCLNAKRSGWSTWYVPSSRVVHLVGQTTGVNNTPRRLPPYLFEARRRHFLKNYGAAYAALADAGRIFGASLWRLRVLLTGKKDTTPPNNLSDSIRHSVFLTGFKVTAVKNPALHP
jgi:GT2 family glycosyltransferase